MTEPAITRQAFHVSAGSNLPVKRIVIHATCPPGLPWPNASASGQAAATAGYFTQPSSGGSAHYICDVAGEEHCVADQAVAWHAPPNPGSIGIEICGQSTYSRDQWLSPQVWPAVHLAATRTRELADRHGVPLERVDAGQLEGGRRGICGHADVTAAWHQSDHTDPGPNFPWPEFMAVVAGGVQPIPPIPPPAPPVPPLDLPGDDDVAQLLTINAGPLGQHGEGTVLFDGGQTDHPGIAHNPTAIRWEQVRGVEIQGSFPPDDGYRPLPKVGRQERDGWLSVEMTEGAPGGPAILLITVVTP